MIKTKKLDQYSVELAKAKINFYEPFQRLILRKIVQDILINTGALRLDLFAIFDAVNKRGGFNKVEQLKRWVQVEYSLPYYKLNFREIYLEHIIKKENEVKKYLKQFGREYKTVQQDFVQLHYIPTTSSGGYYHFEDDQTSFAKQNFIHVDFYMNIKTLCMVRSPVNKIIAQFADKYLLTRKWLIMKGYSQPYCEEQLDQLKIIKIYNNSAAIALVGWSIPNILLALKLHQLKFNVVLYTNFDKTYDVKYLQKTLSAQEGIFVLDDGVGGPFSYSELFKHNFIELAEVSNYCGLIDENEGIVPEFRVRQSQELFLALLADFKFQEGNKKTLASELNVLLQKKKINDQFNLTTYHLERYLMLNNLHGEDTTLNLHYNFLNRRKHKIFMYRKRPVYIKSCSKLVQKALKSFKIVHTKPKTIDFCNNMWSVQQRANQRRIFSCLVYSDSQQVFQMLSKKSYKVPSMQHQNFVILKDLAGCRWLHCSFRFKDKLSLKNDALTEIFRRKQDFMNICQYDISEENCSFQLNRNKQFYYYFVIQNGHGLIASCKVDKHMSSSSTSIEIKQTLSREMMKCFQIHILNLKLPQLSEPQILQFSHFFYMKDESLSRERIIKLKNWQRLYLSIGFPWGLSANKLTSHIDVSNQILALISNVYYPLYKYDQKTKQKFSRQYIQKKKQILNKQEEISKQISSQTNLRQVSHDDKSSPTKIMIQQIQNTNSQKKQKQKQKKQIENFKPIIKSQVQIKTNTLNIKIQCVVHPNQKLIFNTQGEKLDFFGFNHSFIQSTFTYLLKQISSLESKFKQNYKNRPKKDETYNVQNLQQDIKKVIKQFQDTFQLQKPYKLNNTTYLHSIGKSYVLNINTTELLKKLKKIQAKSIKSQQSIENLPQISLTSQIKIYIFDGFMTKKQYYSLQNPYKTTIYIQFLTYFKKQTTSQLKPYFIIFQQTNLAIFYYHTSLKKLTDAFNAYIQKRKQIQKSHPIHRTDPRRINQNSGRLRLLLQEIKQKIEKQIKFSDQQEYLSEDQHLDRILLQKLKGEVPRQIYENPHQNNIYQKIHYPEQNQQKSILLINSLNRLVKDQLKLNGLKSDINMFDIFFGYLSYKYLAFEILLSKLQQLIRQSTSYINGPKIDGGDFKQILLQVKQKDPSLFQQLDKIINGKSEINDQDFPLQIQYSDWSLIVKRRQLFIQERFLSSKNDNLQISQMRNDQIPIEQEQSQRKNKKRLSKANSLTYYVNKQQNNKTYFFIKQFNFLKQGALNEKRSDKVCCYLLAGENQQRIELDPKQNPLEYIITTLVDTWREEQIFEHFKNIVKKQIWKVESYLNPKLRLYYNATRKDSSLLQVDQLSQVVNVLSFRKNDVSNKFATKQGYPTEFCSDQDQKQTIFQHLEEGNMIFLDNQIIICKY